MIINRYRIKKSIELFKAGRKNGRNIFWSISLCLDWFSSGFSFNGDNPKLDALRASKV